MVGVHNMKLFEKVVANEARLLKERRSIYIYIWDSASRMLPQRNPGHLAAKHELPRFVQLSGLRVNLGTSKVMNQSSEGPFVSCRDQVNM